SKRLISLQKKLEAAQVAYPDRPAVTEKVQTALRMTRQLIETVRSHQLNPHQKEDLLFRLQVKEKQLQKASAVASNITADLSVADPVLTRGDDTQVTLSLHNDSASDLTDLTIQPILPDGWKATTEPFSGKKVA